MTTKHFGPVLAGPAKGDAMNENSSLLLGALVADAACLGLHWIYNVDRIAEVTERQGGQCACSCHRSKQAGRSLMLNQFD